MIFVRDVGILIRIFSKITLLEMISRVRFFELKSFQQLLGWTDWRLEGSSMQR